MNKCLQRRVSWAVMRGSASRYSEWNVCFLFNWQFDAEPTGGTDRYTPIVDWSESLEGQGQGRLCQYLCTKSWRDCLPSCGDMIDWSLMRSVTFVVLSLTIVIPFLGQWDYTCFFTSDVPLSVMIRLICRAVRVFMSVRMYVCMCVWADILQLSSFIILQLLHFSRVHSLHTNTQAKHDHYLRRRIKSIWKTSYQLNDAVLCELSDWVWLHRFVAA